MLSHQFPLLAFAELGKTEREVHGHHVTPRRHKVVKQFPDHGTGGRQHRQRQQTDQTHQGKPEPGGPVTRMPQGDAASAIVGRAKGHCPVES